MSTNSNLSTLSQIDRNWITTFPTTKAQILEKIQEIKQKNKLLELENFVLETHLQRVDPTALLQSEPPEELQDLRKEKQSIFSLSVRSQRMSNILKKQKVLKTNTEHLIEITTREIYYIDVNIELHQRNFEKQKFLNESRLKAISAENVDLEKFNQLFTQNVLQVRHPITKRITERTLMTFATNWIHIYDTGINKLRVEKLKLQKKLKNITSQLETGSSLASYVIPIDFEVAHICNENLKKGSKEKTSQYRNLRDAYDYVALAIHGNEFINIKKANQLDHIKEKIEKRQSQIKLLENEIDKIKCTLNKDKEECKIFKKYLKCYENPPSVYDYIQSINILRKIKTDIKMYEKKHQILKINLLFNRKQYNKYKSVNVNKYNN